MRPYFIPAELIWDDLPEAVRAAMESIVSPAYHELVLGATSALERSVGVTVIYLLAEEVLDQFALAASWAQGAVALGRNPSADADDAAQQQARSQAREQAMDRHLRKISSKFKAVNFLVRLRQMKYSDTIVADWGYDRSVFDPLRSADYPPSAEADLRQTSPADLPGDQQTDLQPTLEADVRQDSETDGQQSAEAAGGE